MRPTVPKDAAEIALLEEELFPQNCFGERTIEGELTVGEGWVEVRNGWVVGYLFGRSEQSGLFDILRLGVSLEYQSEGIGQRLLREALAAHKDCMLTVQNDNARALHIYRKHGFRVVGVLAANACVMRSSTA